MEENDESFCIWTHVPDSILLEIFSHLNTRDLLASSLVCREWYRLSRDDTLWRSLVQVVFNIRGPLVSPRESWREEYIHLYYHTPVVLSETLTQHEDEVLHICFSHNGKMFSTTSKDCTLRVWKVGYPTQLIHTENFRNTVSWDFTQFSCFNDTDTMLMVSSVKRTEYVDRRGYLAVLSILHDFQLLRLVSMDPSQLFGTWVDSFSFLGGSLEISFDRFATTVNVEAFEIDKNTTPFRLEGDTDAYIEEDNGVSLFTFHSETASLIKFLTVANVPICGGHSNHMTASFVDANRNNLICGCDDLSPPNHVSIFNDLPFTNDKLCFKNNFETNSFDECHGTESSGKYTNNCKRIKYNSDMSKNNESVNRCSMNSDNSSVLDSCYHKPSHKNSSVPEPSVSNKTSRTMIYVTGEFAIALHQIGFKSISPNFMDGVQNVEVSPTRLKQEGYTIDLDDRQTKKSDKPDHMLDMNGHVTGLSLSKDNRYLFVNCRRWVGKVDRSDSWDTPELSTDIEVRVIDMTNFTEISKCYRGHKATSESSMCCFIFLDASDDFIASGSEDCRGYLWDRHYGILLSTYEHGPGVVNAVGFNPVDQEYFVTVSDDHTIRVWRSRRRMNAINKEPTIYMSVK